MWKLLLILALLTPSSFATSYFVDCATGNDANNGTAKATPWAHAPGMNGFTATYSHVAGDQIIFKGGVTCSMGGHQWKIPNSGTLGTSDYYGVDNTWFTGGGWTRPILDFQNILIPASAGVFGTNSIGIWITGKSFVTVDNLDVRNFEFPNGKVVNTTVAGSGTGATVTFDTSAGTPTTFSAAWTVGAGFTVTNCDVTAYNATYVATAVTGTTVSASGATTGAATGCTVTQINSQLFTLQAVRVDGVTNGVLLQNLLVHDWDMAGTIVNGSVASGSCAGIGGLADSGHTLTVQNSEAHTQNVANQTCGGMAFGGNTVLSGNHAHHAPEGFFVVGSGNIAHDNTADNITASTDPGAHTNSFSFFCPGEYYNNKSLQPITAGAEVFFMNSGVSGCGANQVGHIYNNIMDGTSNNNPPMNIDASQASTSTSSFYVWNNTMIAGGASNTANGYCTRIQDRANSITALVVTAQNNHCISNNTTPADATFCPPTVTGCINPTTLTTDHNVTETVATANGQGYTQGNNWAPTAGGNPTVGAGVNLTSQGLLPMDSDLLGRARPAVAAWDAGVYMFGAFASTDAGFQGNGGISGNAGVK